MKYSIGSNIKIFFWSLLVISTYSAVNVLHVWQTKSATNLSDGLIIHNYTRSQRCINYKECTYYMCQIASAMYGQVVTVSFENLPTCRAPNWILIDPIAVSYMSIYGIIVILNLLSAILITVRDTRVFYHGYRISSKTWRLIRAAIIVNETLFVFLMAVGIYYRVSAMPIKMPSLEVLSYAATHISDALAVVFVGYFFITSLSYINKQLDKSREGLEDDEPLLTEQ